MLTKMPAIAWAWLGDYMEWVFVSINRDFVSTHNKRWPAIQGIVRGAFFELPSSNHDFHRKAVTTARRDQLKLCECENCRHRPADIEKVRQLKGLRSD
jgi:hypothetical protein